MKMPPLTTEQLDRLLGTADRRRLTPDEAAALRAGVRQLRAQLAGAGAAVRRAPSGAYVVQLQQQAARASRYRAAWQSARRRAARQDTTVDPYHADHIAELTRAVQAASDAEPPEVRAEMEARQRASQQRIRERTTRYEARP
ncbi:hypothetical protein ACFVVU_23600 [Kitasatospora sp. NPDC057965]|uniref:hypothetical protein n=1 Tax=Kitasatospora sp. NPDC057965 TaxID=3346291 RepID=UPI0036DDFE34